LGLGNKRETRRFGRAKGDRFDARQGFNLCGKFGIQRKVATKTDFGNFAIGKKGFENQLTPPTALPGDKAGQNRNCGGIAHPHDSL
jgi:hypothetical protein